MAETYTSREESSYSSQPIELYEFANGGRVWRYTSSDQVVSDATQDYLPEQILRTNTVETQEINKTTLKVTLPWKNPVAEMFHLYPPTDVTTIHITRKQSGVVATQTVWVGRVLNADYNGTTVELHCEPATTSIRRLGLRKYYQRQCPHVLYGVDCKLDKAAFSITTTITAKYPTNTLKIAVAFSLAVLLGTSLFASSENVKNGKSNVAKTAIIDLIASSKLTVKACPGG